jgi:hypothetical protein
MLLSPISMLRLLSPMKKKLLLFMINLAVISEIFSPGCIDFKPEIKLSVIFYIIYYFKIFFIFIIFNIFVLFIYYINFNIIVNFKYLC